jgi:hypothetical protein
MNIINGKIQKFRGKSITQLQMKYKSGRIAFNRTLSDRETNELNPLAEKNNYIFQPFYYD